MMSDFTYWGKLLRKARLLRDVGLLQSSLEAGCLQVLAEDGLDMLLRLLPVGDDVRISFYLLGIVNLL